MGDGSTTDRLIKDVTAGAIQSEYNFNFVTTGNVNKFVTINAATSTTAGVMTADDKAKLDDIENTYLPLSGGNIDGNLNVDGAINTKSNITTDGTVTAKNFVSKTVKNRHDVWACTGGSIDLTDILRSASIYVAGGFELAESSIDNTTVVDNPDSIIYDRSLGGRFLAKKGLTYYTHWKVNINKNIAPPSRYGIETDNGVVPFDNQMYKFIADDDIYIANWINGSIYMSRLLLK